MKKNNGYTINHTEQAIVITKDFAKRAELSTNTEFHILVQLHKAYPDYNIRNRTASSNRNKKVHRGLTIEFMSQYIAKLENADTRLQEFEYAKEYYRLFPAYYAKVKAWFLKNYPDYDNDELAA